jgi:hypothetical protein
VRSNVSLGDAIKLIVLLVRRPLTLRACGLVVNHLIVAGE